MAEDLVLPVISIAALLWCLLCAVWQQRSRPEPLPVVLWRQALATGWSDWVELHGISSTADYATTLAAVGAAAHPDAIAVQFASVVRTDGAPEYTPRVLFKSAVRANAGLGG